MGRGGPPGRPGGPPSCLPIEPVAGLTARLGRAGRRWSAGHPARRLFAVLGALTCLLALAASGQAQGQSGGW